MVPPLVTDPLPFPQPVIVPSAVRRLPVISSEGIIREQLALQTSSGNFYEFGRILRESIYGQVNHGIRLTKNDSGYYNRLESCAIKVYIKARLRSYHGKTQENPISEISAHQYIGYHENIINPIECCHDSEYIYAIMEYCDGGELFDLIEETGAFTESRAKIYFKQILSGVSHLQSRGIGHRDLSLENILHSSKGICKVIDFGMCLRVPQELPRVLIPPQGVCGKRNYISPEVLANLSPFNLYRSDIWAVGVMLFIMLTGIPPVESATPVDPRYRMLRDSKLPEMLQQWSINLSNHAVDLLERILKCNPTERLSIAEIQQHPWIVFD